MSDNFGGYATLKTRNLDPADCDHSRRTAHDSHRCLDCRQDVWTPEDEAAKATLSLDTWYRISLRRPLLEAPADA